MAYSPKIALSLCEAPRGYEQRMPQQLQQRLERSFLLESRSPRLPPVEPLLYAAPKGTEMKLRRAFKGLVPREAPRTARFACRKGDLPPISGRSTPKNHVKPCKNLRFCRS